MGYFKFTTIKTIANNDRRMGATGRFDVKSDYLGVIPDFESIRFTSASKPFGLGLSKPLLLVSAIGE